MKSVTYIIAENIRRRRKQLGLTQEELGEALGYSVKTVSKWESGNGTPPTVILPELALALKTDVGQLLTEESKSHFYLGIDGGGTKTEFALADENGKIVRSLLLGTSNPSDIGIKASLEVLRAGISEICAQIPKSSISLFAGLAGGSTEGISEQLGQIFNSFGFEKARHGSDAKSAVAAGLGKRDGIVVIMGTGSVAFAQHSGKQTRVGGYGYLLGDGGSGFAFGRDAILTALQYEDGSGEASAIVDLVKAQCGSENVLEKLGSFYEGGKRTIAGYASCVFEAYRTGDAVAEAIIRNNLKAIAQTIRGAANSIPKDLSPIPVVLCGGLASAMGEIIAPLLAEMLARDSKKYDASICQRSMIYGALTLAGMPETNETKENLSC